MSDAFWATVGTVLVTLIGLATLFVQQHFAFKKASYERRNATDDAIAAAKKIEEKLETDGMQKEQTLTRIEHLVNSEADRMRREIATLKAEIAALKALLASTIAANGKSA